MREIFVANEHEISDGGRKIVIDDKVEIGVFRVDGAFYAWRNDCPHQGGPVCEGVRMPQVEDVVEADGTLSGQRFNKDDMHIVCPWHGYEFHLVDGRHVNNPRVRLQKFEVSVRDGEVYVAL